MVKGCAVIIVKQKSILKHIRIILLDLFNRIRYGPISPRYAELIWVNPQDCKWITNSLNDYSGRVVKRWPPKENCKFRLISDDLRINSCFERWCNNISWKDTKCYHNRASKIESRGFSWDGECRSEIDLIEKYNCLDQIFDFVKKEGRLRTRKELNPDNFREEGTFLIHIGPEGELYLGGGGYHRFAMALILKMELVPAQLGCVHISALKFLPRLRQKLQLTETNQNYN